MGLPLGQMKQLGFQLATAFVLCAEVMRMESWHVFFPGSNAKATGTKNFRDRSSGAVLYWKRSRPRRLYNGGADLFDPPRIPFLFSLYCRVFGGNDRSC